MKKEIVKDGEIVSVPLRLMDGTQRAISQHHTLTDGLGRPAGQRPGYVFSGDPKVIAAQKVADAQRVTRMAIMSGDLRPTGVRGRERYLDRLSNPGKYRSDEL